jgi:hypothetical protein
VEPGGRRFRAWPSKPGSEANGVRVEVFAPGDKKLTALWKSRAAAAAVIPPLTFREIQDLFQEAREATGMTDQQIRSS